MRASRLLAGLALQAVPRHLRESVQGDLQESGGGAREALAVALHFQAEPYREAADRHQVLLLLAAGAGLLWIVPMAARQLLAQSVALGDTLGGVALHLWGAPSGVAALACGLLVGGASGLADHARAARLHIVLALVPLAALAAPGATQALLAAGLVPFAAGLARLNRQAV